MKERPILFSGAMVRAILAGTKTQTRRIASVRGIGCEYLTNPSAQVPCPYGAPYDRLWVRETWAGDDCCGFVYRADHPNADLKRGDLDDGEQSIREWRPSIFMPRDACRITLEIVSVRVGRLSDITEADALAEGFTRENVPPLLKKADPKRIWPIARNKRELFSLGWDAINGKRAPWASNPWVWRVEFRRVAT